MRDLARRVGEFFRVFCSSWRSSKSERARGATSSFLSFPDLDLTSFSFSLSSKSKSSKVPALNIFESSLKRGKFDANRTLSDGSLMEFAHILPMDAGENF